MSVETTLGLIKKEIEELLVVEGEKREYHRDVTKDRASEYFYRGRLAYMRHLLNVINLDEHLRNEQKED